MTELATITVAPNGARPRKRDHACLPVTLPEIVRTARSCHAAGAGLMHLHMRDAEERHVLDAGLFREACAAIHEAVPGLKVQVTTEANGAHSSAEQRRFARKVLDCADALSFSVAEMFADDAAGAAAAFYREAQGAGVPVQHIVYGARDTRLLTTLVRTRLIPETQGGPQALFVLGKKSGNAAPGDILPFLKLTQGLSLDWAACAFGPRETACLAQVARLGGKVRVGFENNWVNADGTIASSNAERVREVALAIEGATQTAIEGATRTAGDPAARQSPVPAPRRRLDLTRIAPTSVALEALVNAKPEMAA